jgi:FixJ family two-component response regulator
MEWSHEHEAMQDSLHDLMGAAGLAALCFGAAEEFLKSDLYPRAAWLIVDIRMPKMPACSCRSG